MHPLQPVDLTFFERAPFRIEKSLDVACAAGRVTESLRNNADWALWARPIERADWTSSPAGAQGSTRDVWLWGGVRLSEVFFCWDEGKRVAFYIAAASVPGLTRFAEDYQISPLHGGAVRLKWTLAFEAAAPGLGWVVKAALMLVTPAWLTKFKNLLENHY